MQTPRLVYACNHYIKETYSETLTKQMDRSTKTPELSDNIDENWLKKYEFRDVLITPQSNLPEGNIIITSSLCNSIEYDKDEPFSAMVSANSKVYKEGYDYDLVVKPAKVGQFVFLDWIKDRATHSVLPHRYNIKLWYERHFSKQYKASDCPRCCGDNWYAGLFENGMVNAELVSDANRLIQSFFKYIYTKKQADGFGSTLLTSLGKYNVDEEQMFRSIISSEIDAFVTYYKNQTSVMMLEGDKFNDDEILESYYVTDISRDKGEFCIKVKIMFYTKQGAALNVSIVLPEE